jgi:ABC-type uncharacterized transport system permease subunit
MPRFRRRARTGPTLPTPLRVIRVAEMLFFPVVAFLLLCLPVPSTAREGSFTEAGQYVVWAVWAVAVVVMLGRRRRWGWVLALALATWVVVTILVRGAPVVRTALAHPSLPVHIALGLLAWTFLTQLVVLVSCLTFTRWREELG